MSKIELRLLRYFVAVAEEGHLTKAAQRIGIQQPPLSQQIRHLEEELGVTLFKRLPRGMELTECGEALLGDAYKIFAQVETSIAGVRRVAQGETGHLSIGFTESASLHPFVPGLLRAFRETSPEVSMQVEELNTPGLAQALLDKKLDAGFIRSPISRAEGLVIECMLIEEMIAALPSAHPQARYIGEELELAELSEDTFILTHRPNGPGFYDTIIAACHAAGFSPRVGQEAHRNLTTLTLVAAGMGVSVIPASMRYVEMKGIVYRSIKPSPTLNAPLHLAYRADHTSGALTRLIKQARQYSAAFRG